MLASPGAGGATGCILARGPIGAPNQLLNSWRLAQTEGVGPIAWRRLLSRYGSAAAALDALPRLARAGGRTDAARNPDHGGGGERTRAA